MDMDNTIVRSNRIHVKAFNMAFEKAGLKKVPAKKLIEHFGKDKALVVKGVYPKISKKELEKVLYFHNKFVIEKTARHVKVIPGARKALKKLKTMGYKLALLSNCTHAQMEAIIENANIDKNLFEILVGADEVKHSKPSPDEIVKVTKKLGAKACYMVGDSIYDIGAAKKAGVKTISVLTGDQSRSELRKKNPDHIIRSIAALPRLMKKLHPS